MLEFRGAPISIHAPVLGRVQLNPSGYDLVASGSSVPLARIQLRDGHPKALQSEIPSLLLDGSGVPVSEHDVVLLEPDGRAIVLYQAEAKSNALFLTSRCNARCIMCPQPSQGEADGAPLEMALRILDLITTPPLALGITGGEPTVRWKDLCVVVGRIREKFPETNIEVLSNGMRFRDYALVRELAEIGGDRLVIGVPLYGACDSVHDEIVGVPGAFWATLDGLCNLERAGVYVELRNVLQQTTVRDLPDWAEFVARYIPFIGHVALMGLEPTGQVNFRLEELAPAFDARSTVLTSAIRTFRRAGIPARIFNLPLCQIPSSLWSFAEQSISEWKRSYPEECVQCSVRDKCGGIFASWSSFGEQVSPILLLPENLQCHPC